ncbi:hypothetical protein K458DRAFT_490595 [Lentithecium fluviatile CBS 122367]|uniref:Uncharacterized protein n=1 Tax=Lentithecium fluviatile CBS 122367 TaxID=1168545 RepID=A0A6G1INE4_9PLEO|nr:hypothetical protein K458DRAFT_490595 [Lentithecium fluviatile CBS 122367]
MSRPGVNLAVTKDGGSYNKLRRPDDFVAALTSHSSPENEATRATPTDPHKRKLEEAGISVTEDDDEPESKRQKEAHGLKPSLPSPKPFAADPRRIRRPVQDCGMQSMFPGLDDEDSSDEATKEALAYLRSVRSEASTIPKLLVAAPEIADDEPDRRMYNDGRGDYRAVYKDGTWVAMDLDLAKTADDYWSEHSDDLDPQEQYYKSLLRRHEGLRTTLANADPKELAGLVKADPSKYLNIKPPTSKAAWLRTLEEDFPTPARVAHIYDHNIFWGLQHCTETLDRYETISKQKSCWIWTLLAMAPERGTLDYYRIGQIRDLGHKAGQFGILLRNGARQSPPSEDEDESIEEWAPDGEDEEISLLGDTQVEENGETGAAIPESRDPQYVKEGEVNNIGAQGDGADDRDAGTLPPAEKKDDSDDSAAMSMSEDEGEVTDDDESKVEDEAANLEEARARLLAQLGDRLIQPSVPPPKRPRHRHNGKVCKDPDCRKGTQHKGSSRADKPKESPSPWHAPQPQPPASVYASRAEAEMQRQRMREVELAKATMGRDDEHDTAKARVTFDNTEDSEETQGCSKRPIVKDGAEDEEDSKANEEDVDPIDLNTRVTIDMILTVVAECYGQKDLLRFREVW